MCLHTSSPKCSITEICNLYVFAAERRKGGSAYKCFMARVMAQRKLKASAEGNKEVIRPPAKCPVILGF